MLIFIKKTELKQTQLYKLNYNNTSNKDITS